MVLRRLDSGPWNVITVLFLSSQTPVCLPPTPLTSAPPVSLPVLQLSVRRQQVSEKLNEWAVFNEKNKELCEWLTQMESKVSQNGDVSIGEMIEKLRKVTQGHSDFNSTTITLTILFHFF